MADPLAEAVNIIEDLVNQGCYRTEDDLLDSMALSTYAEALRWLARRGRVQLVSQSGRRVVAKWVDTPIDGRDDGR